MKSIKVRFNLGRGQNYMKWKVQYTDGSVEYHSPSEVQLLMHECILKNHSQPCRLFSGLRERVKNRKARIFCTVTEAPVVTQHFVTRQIALFGGKDKSCSFSHIFGQCDHRLHSIFDIHCITGLVLKNVAGKRVNDIKTYFV